MIEIKLEDKGIKRILSNLQKTMNPEAIAKGVGLRLLKSVDDQFKSRGVTFGTPWQKLSEVTISRRRKGSSEVLQDTGILRRSFDLFGVKVAGPLLTIGTNDQRASLHQFGGRVRWGRNWVTIPARPMLPRQDKAISIIKPLLEAVAKKAIQDAKN